MRAQIWSVILQTNVKSLSTIIVVNLREINRASVVCRISQNCCYTPVEAIACAVF